VLLPALCGGNSAILELEYFFFIAQANSKVISNLLEAPFQQLYRKAVKTGCILMTSKVKKS